MNLRLTGPGNAQIKSKIQVTGSKSESNRLLLLQALYPNISIENLSNSDDALVMRNGLKISRGEVDIHHAGTAMRFLTSYFASQEGKEVTLTGSKRMTERPVRVLVDALRNIGADVTYQKNEGYPPIKIRGKKLSRSKVSLPATISSQYISSLLLIAPSLAHGLELELIGNITSVPYIKMTLGLLERIGVKTYFEGNTIRVAPKETIEPIELIVESDWSSASYFYGIVALSQMGTDIVLSSYKKNSLQGDSVLSKIYRDFGVDTEFKGNEIILRKTANCELQDLNLELSNAPDIAQTIAVTCFGLGIGCHLTGLHTLKIKETDRLEAMKTELSKFGAIISVTENTLTLEGSTISGQQVTVDTYNDHRMAMAFAPLALKKSFVINDADVVSKSYPDFWTDLETLKFTTETL